MSQQIVLGGGCFWCTEATYQLIEGVEKVVPGYAGGTGAEPSYSTIHGSPDGWAETVQVTFNPEVITLKDILDIFWVIHDPTTPNRQGADVGPEYRSIILFNNPEQEAIIKESIAEAQKVWGYKVVTEVKPLDKFYEAEAEHHNYFVNHPENAYCQVVINPKLAKLKDKFAARLKK
jgi:methionine-S-sulfoxide reductase